MQRRSVLTTLIIVLALMLPVGVAAQSPPGPTTRHQFRLDGLPVAGPAEMVTFEFEFAPGAATPPHTHPGLVFGTVLEGELVFRTQGEEKVYHVGDTLTELPNVVGTALNLSPARTRVTVSMVVPKAAAPSTPQPGGPSPAPPAPTALYLTRADAFFPGESYEVVQAVLDFAPGTQTPPHTHPGQVFVTVLEGEITHRAGTGGPERTYKVGESFLELPRVVGQARNAGTAPATMMATYILPKGAPLSTPVAAPGLRLPATGAGDVVHRPTALAVALLLGGLLLAGGSGLRRCLGRA